ncbi:PqqD family protein [Bacillus sp. ISL-41]|uniref:PqqD family protein n=1 Tax=Bacillus sp. ISL-41 TaxID=2819127 RepID=UPI001BE56088|nr:PqqD family protein [Bacillus sp. ISL-41]MBT2642220.1 PqqD family protein [Bacillus sp. ISL-41]
MTAQYIQKRNYEATELDDEWIILDPDRLTVTKLNQVGGYCWSLLKEPQTSISLTRKVMQDFSSNLHEGLVISDIEDFLFNLQRCGLIKNVD